jgi:putative oxidoreductase
MNSMIDGRRQASRKGDNRMAASSVTVPQTVEAQPRPNGAVVLLGRFLFALIFLLAGPSHFSQRTIAFATSQGVPLAHFAVPASGVLALLGGLSILLGYRVRFGAWLIVLFLLPVTFLMHRFWGISDPVAAQTQMALFMKNIALIGGALFISQFGAGLLSLDSRGSR